MNLMKGPSPEDEKKNEMKMNVGQTSPELLEAFRLFFDRARACVIVRVTWKYSKPATHG